MSDSEKHQRIILLNRLVSRSVSQAPQEHKNPPIHDGLELLKIIKKKCDDGFCIEFFDVSEESEVDKERIAANRGKNFIRVNKIEFNETTSATYCTILIDYIDNSVRSFPVVDIAKFEGRELAGEEDERGATSAHVLIRIPPVGEYDDGTYRCALEAVQNVTRQNIEYALCRQLRRNARLADWTYSVQGTDKKGKSITKSFKYHPRLELMADVGRVVGGVVKGSTLSRLVFTKRAEKQSALQPTAVVHDDVHADVRLQISAKQGPTDPLELKAWVNWLRDSYEKRGFTTKLYFRHVSGGEFAGGINAAIDGATDLLMCHREFIEIAGEPKKWVGSIQPHIRDAMKELVDRDELWERAK